MDILVGWHIDTQQDESLINFIAGKYFRLVLTLQNSLSLFSPSLESLVSLQQFWIEDISFSVDLLKQFLEDMDAYTNVSVNNRQHNIQCTCVSLYHRNLLEDQVTLLSLLTTNPLLNNVFPN